MKKKRRVPLAITILVPVLLGVALVQGGALGATYFYSRESNYNDTVATDRIYLLNTMWVVRSTAATAAVEEIKKVYDANAPEKDLTDPTEIEAYRKLFFPAVRSEAYVEFSNNFPPTALGDYADYVSVGFFDQVRSRFITVYFQGSGSMYNPSFPGSFDPMSIDEGSWHNGTFYGLNWWDPKRSDTYLISGSSSNTKNPLEGFWIIRHTALRTVYSESNEFMSRFWWVAAASMAAMAVLSFLAIQFLLLNPIRRLSKTSDAYVEEMEKGHLLDDRFHLDKKRYKNELTTLNDSLFYMQGAMLDYSDQLREGTIREQKTAADLALAERIQASMVPNEPLLGDGFSVFGKMHPAKEVGGDFFSYFKIDENRIGFYIADVSGKGVPAALFMARAATVSRLLIGDLDIERIGEVLAKDNGEDLFVTGFFAVVDKKKNELHYVNCGHEPVFLRHNGVYAPLDEAPNLPLGCLEDFPYVKQKIALADGDALFLYTDGLSEAMNKEGDLFGKEAILNTLNDNAIFAGEELFSIMDEEVAKFVNGAEQSDDTCFLYFEYSYQKSFPFKPDIEGLASASAFVEETLVPVFGPAHFARLAVVLDETVSNVVRYSGAKEACITLTYNKESVRVTISDDGVPFDPTTAKVHKEEWEPGGFGILLAGALTSALRYRYASGHNILTFEMKADVKEA